MDTNSFSYDSGTVTCTTNIDVGTSTNTWFVENCTFCGKISVKTVYFKSGQHIHLCEEHKNDLENELGLVKERIYVPYIPFTPVVPGTPWVIPSQPTWTTPNVTCGAQPCIYHNTENKGFPFGEDKPYCMIYDFHFPIKS